MSPPRIAPTHPPTQALREMIARPPLVDD